jgi:hypothetical protein
MRASKWIPAAASLLMIGTCSGQDIARTDAQTDGFNGPVKSVLSTTIRHDIHWSQPDGLALIWPVGCPECYYDPDGARVRTGQRYPNGFQGSNILLTRDPQGHISDRRIVDASTGDLKVHEVLGPFGMTDQTYYEQGKVTSSQIIRYDSFGHISETSSFDSSGQQTEHSHSTYTKEGVFTEDSVWSSNGQLKWRHLFDPEKDTESFTTFDDAGIMKLAWTRKDGKMTSFWERSEETNQFGDCLNEDEDKNGMRESHCLANGNRERAVIRYQFVAPKSHHPKSAEWRDGAGKLLYAAYYDYEFDSHRNWTRRSISVISPELPERTLYEEDTRILVYW